MVDNDDSNPSRAGDHDTPGYQQRLWGGGTGGVKGTKGAKGAGTVAGRQQRQQLLANPAGPCPTDRHAKQPAGMPLPLSRTRALPDRGFVVTDQEKEEDASREEEVRRRQGENPVKPNVAKP